MKKLLSLCLALCLCLGLLPATALAADGATVYVGGEELTGSADSPAYATTDDNTGEVTVLDATPSDNQWNIKWDGDTLTLDDATITAQYVSSNAASAYGIYAPASGNQPVSLTIELQGANTVSGSIGIYVLEEISSTTGGATLTITGDGSLDASGGSGGIRVVANHGDATLTIQDADVTADGGAYDVGVLVQAGESSDASLTVDGGSLTTTGGGVGGGIEFRLGSGDSSSGTPSLNVSGSAIVKASGSTKGITSNSSTAIQYETGSDSTGGIVFDGDEGTVYGNVTLQEDLEIGEGESLKLADNSACLTAGDYNVIVDGGTLLGNLATSLGDSVKYPPSITTTTLTDGKVGESYNATLGAEGTTPITWSIAEDSSLPDGLRLNGDGTITGTPTTANTYTFTVTATNEYGNDSKELSLMIGATTNVPVNSVSLSLNTLNLEVGDEATLTATVAPDNATNKNVTWSTSNASVATVDDNGNVTAKAAGTANITATADGIFATCTVTVTEPSEPEPEPEPEPDPEPTPPPYIPPTPSKTPSQQALEGIENARQGDTVTVTLRPGQTTLDGEVLEALAGRDVTLELRLTNGAAWTIKGRDVPTDTSFADTDFGVSLNTTGIDVDVINAITGEVGSVQITLAHDGAFGFTLTLTAPLGAENTGYWANLYHYDETKEALFYETSGEIQEDGTAALRMTHASQYAILIDEQSHELPFTDLGEGQWYESAVRYAYLNNIMEGMSDTIFQPNGVLSRAMAVQILYNLEGQPDISDENLGYPYEDVNAQVWYGNAVYWARITSVAEGDGDGTFRPTDSITRQEFAQVLYNYAKYKGYDLTADGDLSTFPDSGNIAGWAETAMNWANGNELINGHDDGTIDPKGTTTRAQAASILMKFDQNLVEK